MNANRSPMKIFEWEYATGVNNWCTEIETIFNDINCSEYFNNKTKCNIDECARRMENECIESWNTTRFSKPKLRVYNTFKHAYGTDKYVMNCDKHIRSHIAQIRSGILPLNIELGRHNNLAVKDRICNICDKQEVEDEMHFICNCPAYDNFRNVLYNDMRGVIESFDDCSINDKFNYIMSLCNKNVGRYIVNSFQNRRNLLYKKY